MSKHTPLLASLMLCASAFGLASQNVQPLGSPGPRTLPGIEHAWFFTDGAYQDLGSSVSGAGDVNGDGFDDIIVGAQAHSSMIGNGGKAMVFHGSASGFGATPDWTTFGDQDTAYYGNQVSSAGDVNADGYDDVLVTTLYYDGPNGDQAGRVWLYLGSPTGLSTTADWFADGEQAVALFGSAIAAAGDVNADGFDDIVIGSFSYDDPVSGAQVGRVYLYLGSATGPGATPDWIATGRDFMVSWGYGSLGNEVDGAGDVNGDGYDDIIVAADYSIAVFFGTATGLEPDPAWTNNELLQIGQDVAGVGDINGDGYDDIASSTPNYSNPELREGAAVLWLGGPSGPETSYSWLTEADSPMAFYGYSLGGGDLNGDGYSDLIIGSLFFSDPEMFEGHCRVYYGSPTSLSTEFSWEHQTNVPGTRFGIASGCAGDVNGDGYADIVVGANTFPNPDGSSGRATVFHGGPDTTAYREAPGRVRQ